ncbi:heavy metal-associated isoprenylated plant protein 28-like [Lotus japonicus]|uniref:heavy metal-associated isoprenylated plant protein 28-like n=1 Tax=Lotus japonicus TaxID=34305 RepID=UPI00258873C4|nr:heavy metal-associated isoprenylated plant protein 28-like [Lotus japonicus]
MTIVEMCVHMDCAGCENKIRKALTKLRGVDSVEIDMGMQKVTVMGWAEQKKVLRTVRKTGRRAELWPYPYEPEYHAFTRNYSYKPSSSHKHGYSNGEDFGYYRKPIGATLIKEKAMAMFSDDNPHACFIM